MSFVFSLLIYLLMRFPTRDVATDNLTRTAGVRVFFFGSSVSSVSFLGVLTAGAVPVSE